MKATPRSWPVRSVIAGAAGTTTMTLAYAAERRLRKNVHGPLDYDDSLVPGKIVASVMHLPHVTDREDHELGLALRWGYGSAFGLMHGLLHRRLQRPAVVVSPLISLQEDQLDGLRSAAGPCGAVAVNSSHSAAEQERAWQAVGSFG